MTERVSLFGSLLPSCLRVDLVVFRVLNGEDTQYEPVDTAEDARTPPEPVKKVGSYNE